MTSPVFVGREDELARLEDAFIRARRETAEAVLIGGEAGIGKSRLVREFTGRIGDSVQVLTGGCVELGGQGLPFAPFASALRGLIRDMGAEGLVDLLVGDTPGDLARLAGNPGVPGADTGELLRARLFERVLVLLERQAAEQPVILFIEDLHWADRSSVDLLEFLIRNKQAIPGLLIIVTYRSDQLDRALQVLLAELSRMACRIQLERLPRHAVKAQLRGILGREPDARLVHEIHQRSDGNPLFVEVLEAGDPSRAESLRDLFLARVERLPEEARRVVRAASVAGTTVRHTLLTKVTGGADIRSAIKANVLIVDGDAYGFRHALLREAVYGDLLPAERVELHGRYAEALDGPAAELAYHWYEAGDARRALDAAWQAANEAAAALAYTEQLRMLDRVLELRPDVAESPGGMDGVLELAVEAADRAGEHERGVAHANAALAREIGPGRAARILIRRGRMRWHLGQPNDIDDLREAVRLAPAGQRAGALAALASRLMESGDTEAKTVAEEALTAARSAADAAAEATALISLATLKVRKGDLDGQLPYLREAQEIARKAGAHGVLMRAIHYQSHLLAAFGAYRSAIETARRGIAAASDAGLARTSGAEHYIDLVEALTALGRWDEALEGIERGLDLAPTPALRAHLLRWRAVIALARGDTAAATALIRENREVIGGRGTLDPHEWLPLTVLEIELSLAEGAVEDALAVAERAAVEYDLRRSSRFTWPLLVAMARAGAVDLVREQATELPVVGPVQAAYALTFDAEFNSAAWDAAAAAWEDVGDPYRTACALTRAAHVSARADRDAATASLFRAFELASPLDARPLLNEIEDLARRAHVSLRPGHPSKRDNSFGLTPREWDVLHLVVDGRDNREIAEALYIRTKTASVHVSNIMAKLGVGSRVEVVVTAHRLGLSPR